MYKVGVRKGKDSSVPQNHSESQVEGDSASCQGQLVCQCPVSDGERVEKGV